MSPSTYVLTVLLTGVMLGCVACKAPNESTSMTLLTAPKWRLTGWVFHAEGYATPDKYPPGLEACNRDDFTSFKANGTYVDDQGLIKCRPDVPQARCFRWRFLAGGRKLGMCYAAPGQKEVEMRFTVKTLTPATLILEGWSPTYSCNYTLTYAAF